MIQTGFFNGQGESILVQPKERGGLIVQSIVISAHQQRGAAVCLYFSDGDVNNNHTLYKGYLGDAPINIQIELGVEGWQGAWVEARMEGEVQASVSIIYDHKTLAAKYPEWAKGI